MREPYYLCRTSNLEDEGYAALAPLRFTITRNGGLKVAGDDREVFGFAYSTTGTVDGKDCPILQVPAYKEATVALSLEVAGDMADMTRAFGFEMTMPEGVAEISATVAGTPVVLTSENSSFVLGHGQSVVLEGVPAACAYVFTQTDERVAVRSSAVEGMYVPEVATTRGDASYVTATQDANDLRVVTLTGIAGTSDNPARVTIANRLEPYNAPATGVGDNAPVWTIIILMSLGLIVLIRGRRIVQGW